MQASGRRQRSWTASGAMAKAGTKAWMQARGTSASSAIRQRAELRLGGVGGMARQTRHAAYPRRALSSEDTGEDRALAFDALSAQPARGDNILALGMSAETFRASKNVLGPREVEHTR